MPQFRRRLRLGSEEPLTVVRRVMLLDGTPVNYLVSFMSYNVGHRVTKKALERQPLEWLLPRRFGVPLEKIVQTIEPIVADIEVARHLEVPIGSPILLVERDFVGRTRKPVYHTQAFFRGDRYKYSVETRLDR